MKWICVVAVSLLFFLAPLSVDAREKGTTKITKNEAEHIALKQHPNARVTSAKLEEVGGKPVWLIQISGPSNGEQSEVSVDANSGRVLSDAKSNR
jgi:uncharacterized membrane protein YkoI